MQLRGILEAVLYARDLAAAERFYTEVLGLAAFQREEGRHVFFRWCAGAASWGDRAGPCGVSSECQRNPGVASAPSVGGRDY
jgi:catechol 2,3-dioxygenase-like lactoylglutathione lyase family enzyme